MIHILNCVSMSPWWPRWHLGGFCLLVETDEGPVLVDTGLGAEDYIHRNFILNLTCMVMIVPLDPEEAAIRQVE